MFYQDTKWSNVDDEQLHYIRKYPVQAVQLVEGNWHRVYARLSAEARSYEFMQQYRFLRNVLKPHRDISPEEAQRLVDINEELLRQLGKAT